jgi:hypothetical protein
VPQNAIFLTTNDIDTFTVWYYHFGLKWRPDIRVVSAGLLKYPWYRQSLAYHYKDLIIPEGNLQNWERHLVNLNPGYPVCQSWQKPSSEKEIVLQCN